MTASISSLGASATSSWYSTISTASQTGSVATTASSTDDSSSSTSSVAPRHHRHHGGGGDPELFSKIQSAVSDALSTASSDPGQDPNDIVKSAISSVLGKQPQDGPAPVSTDGSNGATGSTSPAASEEQGQVEKFSALLEAHGIDASQFRQDLTSAIQQARRGNSTGASAFSSVPDGSIVDVAA